MYLLVMNDRDNVVKYIVKCAQRFISGDLLLGTWKSMSCALVSNKLVVNRFTKPTC